jgi:hypothetical protein
MTMHASQAIYVPELARRLRCSIPRAQSLIRSGRIRGRKTARGWATSEAAVEAYTMQRATPLDRPSSTSP